MPNEKTKIFDRWVELTCLFTKKITKQSILVLFIGKQIARNEKLISDRIQSQKKIEENI